MASKKDSRLYPVVTFVLYAGEKPWTAATSLHEIIDFKDIPDTLRKMTADYKIHVIDIRRLQDTTIFKTDVRHVFDFLRCCEDKDALLSLVSSEDYYQNGGIDMCKGLKDLITDSKAEGKAEGIDLKQKEIIQKMLAKGMPISDICEITECDEAYIKELQANTIISE